jgi:ribosomal-protein-alanine N-acetyltransferase
MNTTGKFRRINSHADLPAEIAALDQKFFPRPWKKADWDSLDFSFHGLWIIESERGLSGLALFSTPQDETAHLLKILIIPDDRGSGIVGRFWDFIADELRNLRYLRVFLEVEESNGRARAFYQKLGFHVLRQVKSYYSDGEGAVMMQLTL